MNLARRSSSSSSSESSTPTHQAPDYGSNADQAAEVSGGEAEYPWLAAAEGEVHAAGDTHEHIGVGGERVVEIDGVAFTTGMISALPDFVVSVDALYAYEHAELELIASALREKLADPESFDDAKWLELFGEVYTDLTFDNADHFGTMKGMAGDLEGTNLGVWAGHHEEALGLAAQAAATKDAALADKARVTDAFGAHYLQDAFSAGHLFDKGAAVERAADTGFVQRKLLVAQASTAVFAAHPDVIANYEVCDLGRSWRPFGAESFGLLMQAADVIAPEAFENAPAGAAHDQLSETGVEVFNDEVCWRMMGDDQMDPTSVYYAELATQRSADEVEGALAGGPPPVLDVLGLVPRPTPEGTEQVDSTVEDALGDGMLDALVQQLGKQVESVLDTAVERLPWEVRRVAPEAPEIGVPGGEGPGQTVPEIGIPGGEGPGEALPPGATSYTVRPGDWLSTVAERFYGDPARFDVLFEANRDRIEGFTDPDHIEPGWELLVPAVERAPA
ncbi:MAG: hypothetical protein ABMA64_29170 [Myxococcota bacterium]